MFFVELNLPRNLRSMPPNPPRYAAPQQTTTMVDSVRYISSSLQGNLVIIS